jgi:hypothetical protein
MAQIFSNLELPTPSFKERLPSYDWDMTEVQLRSRDYVSLKTEIDFILRYYWQTCRRFIIAQQTPGESQIGVGGVFSQRSHTAKSAATTGLEAHPLASDIGVGGVFSQRSHTAKSAATTGLEAHPLASDIGVGGVFSQRSQHNRSFAA